MKTNPTPRFSATLKANRWSRIAATLSPVLLIALGARGEIVAPYTPDEHTLHLWHMNEQVSPVEDAVSNGLQLRALENGATLGNESFVGAKNFGTALGTYVGNPATAPGCAGQNAYLAAEPLKNGREDNVAVRYAGENQAFTYEAIVRIDFNPAANFGPDGWGKGKSAFMQLISGDADENADRVFQFRIAPIGTLNNNPQPLLEFINLNKGGSVQSLTAFIPTEGAEAIRAGSWYHLAVTYSGQPDTKDNLQFYWSAVQPKRTTANLIGTGQMTRDLPAGCNPDFAIGQTGRQSPVTPTPNNNFVGLLDEVRLSGVARSPREMLFGESALVQKKTPRTPEVAAAKTPEQKPPAESHSSPGVAVSPSAVTTTATTEAAVDPTQRPGEPVTVINGAIIRGPQSRPRLAIVFSCREFDEAAIATLRTLKIQQTKASFFVSSSLLGQPANRQLVQTILADGHYVGPQSDNWPQLADSQTSASSAQVEAHLNQLTTLGIDRKAVRYFLPTSDQLTSVAAERARRYGLTMVAGTPGTLSFATATVEGTREFVSSEAIVDSILKIDHEDKGLNGFLLLFPLDAGARRADRFNARFGQLLTALTLRGYDLVRVDELLDGNSARKAPSFATVKNP